MGKGVKYSADTEGPRRIKGIINQISFVYEKKKKKSILYTHTHFFFKVQQQLWKLFNTHWSQQTTINK